MSTDPRNNGEETARVMPEGRRFQPGNPGRPKGSRNKLGEAFIEALHEDFQAHGKAVIATVRDERPDQYLKVIASILPKELNVRVSELDDLTDAELDRRIKALAAALSLETGTGEASGREEAPATTGSAVPLQAVH